VVDLSPALEPLYTAEEARAAEEGHDVAELMERAGAAVAREVMQRFPDARRIAVVCGSGSNGGDGRIAARILREGGRDAVETTAVEQADVIVDALFGTGFHGEPREDAAATIERINVAGAPVVSVDVPSGVDASTGEVAADAVRATLTVTFHGRKLGLAVAPGLFHAGEVVVADIGLEPVETEHRLATAAILSLVPRKRAEDSKYSAGSVLVAGGVPGMTGAVCLAAEAAFRADAGYVAVAVPEQSLPVVEAKLLEPVKLTWADALDAAAKATALAIGPGLGRDAAAKELRDGLIGAGEQALVLDADALHELEPGDWGARAVLTPHAGELGRVLGESSGWVDAHRLEAARRCAERFGCVCLLKGADTIVASPGQGVLVCLAEAPGLATAGTGDVLTGILASFLAKGLEPRLAAAAAATAHGLAARGLSQRGLIASDVIAALPAVLP
jgi:ADP-dependent NAD(P)H-hydrate dehydratase / NAD(P)H-hydrate epimerase